MSSEWDKKQAEVFRKYVLGHAVRAGITDQASLAKATGIGTDQLGRYFRGETQPGPANLQKIAAAVPGTTFQHLMVLARRATPEQFGVDSAPAAPPPLHPRAEQVHRLLGDGSPLPAAEREQLDAMLERLLASFEPMRHRRTA